MRERARVRKRSRDLSMQDIASSTLSGLGFVWMHRLIARLWSSLVEEHKIYAVAGITKRMRACLRVVHSFSHSACGEYKETCARIILALWTYMPFLPLPSLVHSSSMINLNRQTS